jgi:hypothetical protein
MMILFLVLVLCSIAWDVSSVYHGWLMTKGIIDMRPRGVRNVLRVLEVVYWVLLLNMAFMPWLFKAIAAVIFGSWILKMWFSKRLIVKELGVIQVFDGVFCIIFLLIAAYIKVLHTFNL